MDAINFHLLEPDYNEAVFTLPGPLAERIKTKLNFLYGEDAGGVCMTELIRILQVYYSHKTPHMKEWEKLFVAADRFSEKDIILITYGDLVRSPYSKPLEILFDLCRKYLKDVFNTLHILPFFPYSSDRGFAILDFEEVDPDLGNWEDILQLKQNFKLMFDGVFNHVSSRSRWFQEFRNQNPDYLDFFTVFSTKEMISEDHLKLIVRPRTSDVLTEFKTLNGNRLVWTTFSPDQIDLNFKNPKVLLKMVEILLTYVRRGADIVRLDAVTYLWEELGTSCVHLDQSHVCIKLLRDVLDAVAPHVALVTETNVPHEDNIRYFGTGQDEAQMVYNFALPPLVLHAFQTENTDYLTDWADGLQSISETTTFFNFLDSHDGIGVTPVRNILPQSEVEMMALRVLEHGGYISYRDNGDGSVSPYELNITWYSAINRENSSETAQLQVKRYIASRSVALVLQGVPGVYLHGLLGSKNDAEAVLEERQTRSINRRLIRKKELLAALEDESSNVFQVSQNLVRLIRKRTKIRAFHPNAAQKIIKTNPAVFCVERTSVDGDETVIAMTNVSNSRQTAKVELHQDGTQQKEYQELVSRKNYEISGKDMTVTLEPYEICWFRTGK